MLGLVASRPKELGTEGSQFGGGHGAFTYSILKAMNGGADQNRDKSVTAGELIDFVRTDVATQTVKLGANDGILAALPAQLSLVPMPAVQLDDNLNSNRLKCARDHYSDVRAANPDPSALGFVLPVFPACVDLQGN
jgi:hypothetical protein